MVERAVPILPSRDLPKTLEFYARLGFENRGAPPGEWDYLILGRGDLELHFIADPALDPLSTAGSCYLFVDDVHTLWAAWRGVVPPDPATGTRVTAVRDTEYGMREFALVDDNGNLLRVGAAV